MKAAVIGPESLPQFEDRLLYHLVDLTGDMPLGPGRGVHEGELAERVAGELGITPDFARQDVFYYSQARMSVLDGVTALEREGLLDALKVMGPWTVRPTRSGRRKVAEWKERWDHQLADRQREIEQSILEQLEQQRLADPAGYTASSRVDISHFANEAHLGHVATKSLLDHGLVSYSTGSDDVTNGDVHITPEGSEHLDRLASAKRPQRDAQEAWLQSPSYSASFNSPNAICLLLISDQELRRRCVDLLTSEGDFDRVIREACVILEDRVRAKVKADVRITGIPLMESAFGAFSGPIQLSQVKEEQVGAMQLYRGTMAFFRNSAGHRLIDSFSQEDALRFVAFVDLLLGMVAEA